MFFFLDIPKFYIFKIFFFFYRSYFSCCRIVTFIKKNQKRKKDGSARESIKNQILTFSPEKSQNRSVFILLHWLGNCVCVCVKVLQAVYSGLCVKIKEVWISIVYNWNSVDTTSGSIEKGSSISFSLHIYFWKKLICHENSIFFSNLMYAFGNMLSITKKVAHFIFRQFSKKFQLYFESFINATS